MTNGRTPLLGNCGLSFFEINKRSPLQRMSPNQPHKGRYEAYSSSLKKACQSFHLDGVQQVEAHRHLQNCSDVLSPVQNSDQANAFINRLIEKNVTPLGKHL
jgi:hypothetical protein